MNILTKILIIEDDTFLANTTGKLLTLRNYDVCIALNGAEGIQKAFEYNPEVILCDINMEPIDGYQVFSVLKESSILDQVPFIFITGNSELKEIRFGMVLGADDYFVKPFHFEDLFITIEKLLGKFKKIKDIGRREFRALFQSTPNGVFLFNGEVIFDANPAMIEMIGLEKEYITSFTIEDIIDPHSFLVIKDKINRCSNGLLGSFCEKVELISKKHKKLEVDLVVSVYEKYSGHSLMAGLCTRIQINEDEYVNFHTDVMKVIEKENVFVNKLPVKQQNQDYKQLNKNIVTQVECFFSKRETEVLCLSMEGLPMKIIADKLSISDRTVEKHRANLMEKTNSKNMIEVIIYALRNNLIEI
ncbi:MAG: response regulator [Prolixibacteraceae bacterium]